MTKMTIEQANEFIAKNKDKINPQYLPQVHFTAPIGWINDPNGLVYFKGAYHLFYQHYPYDGVWGPMHWGHAVSQDLIHWEHLPVALAPDQPYDKNGCFSGSAIVKEDTLWLMYTGNIDNGDGTGQQVQNIAYSKDGIHFEKLASNPVLTGEDLPEELVAAEFRDPKLFHHQGRYYAVVAAKHQDNVGCVVLVGSDNLIDWSFESIFLKGQPHQGFMWECPDFFVLDGQETLVISPMRYEAEGLSYHNLNSSVVVKGKVDWDKKEFQPESFSEIDHGHDFYAPQTLEDDQGRRIMIAWAHTWGRTNYTQSLQHGWAMAMTFPRQLKWEAGQLIQIPVVQPVSSNHTLDQKIDGPLFVKVTGFEVDQDQVIRWGDSQDYLEIRYSGKEKALYLDRRHLKVDFGGEESQPVHQRGVQLGQEGLKQLDILLDVNSIELYVNEGRQVLSSNVYFAEATDRYLQIDESKLTIECFDFPNSMKRDTAQ